MGEEEKTYLSLVLIGHVDSGKSTTAGHLIYKCGGVDQRTLDICQKEAAEGDHENAESLRYAWILDTHQAERQRGITIDMKLWQFGSPKYNFTVIDTPGHRDFVKNMLTGTSQADVALLVVDASGGAFERGMEKHGQTREHLLLAYALGVKQVIVAVNKMDHETVLYSETRYKVIRTQLSDYLRKVGYKPMTIPFVPISGWKGDGLVEPSEKMSWYHGPTLLQALDNVKPPKRPVDKPLRVPVQDVYKIGGIGTVAVGRVEAGTIQPGIKALFAPAGIVAPVKSVERHHQSLDACSAGDNVGFALRNVAVRDLQRGYVASNHADQNPASAVASFEAQIIVMHHPGRIGVGYTPVVHVHTAHVACRVTALRQKMDPHTGEILEETPEFVKQGDACLVELQPQKPLCLETFADFPPLGRFVMRDMRQTVAVGVVKSITKAEDGGAKTEDKKW